MAGLGLSFQPGQNGAGQQPQAPGNRPSPVQEAVKLISTRLPTVASPRSIAPQPLLTAPGAAVTAPTPQIPSWLGDLTLDGQHLSQVEPQDFEDWLRRKFSRSVGQPPPLITPGDVGSGGQAVAQPPAPSAPTDPSWLRSLFSRGGFTTGG